MAADIQDSLGFETLTPDATTPVKLTVPKDEYGFNRQCIAYIECAKLVDSDTKGNVGVRWTDNGTAPTTKIGMELNPGDKFSTCVGLSKIQFIGVATNSRINVRYAPYPNAATLMPPS